MNQRNETSPTAFEEKYKAVLVKIEELQRTSDHPILVGIDGKCAAGKSTLGEFLKQHFDCNLFHMDDFFLQNEQRTPERLAEIGGNVDYERFYQEVLTSLLRRQDVLYRPFQCSSRQIKNGTWIPYKRLNIIEGSYSLHPYFRQPYHLKIFLDLEEQQQIECIRRRNGDEILKRFVEEWIPKENAYFQTFHIREDCMLFSR